MFFNTIFASTAALRDQRTMLLARYDCGAIAPALFAVLKNLETEISWRQHLASTLNSWAPGA